MEMTTAEMAVIIQVMCVKWRKSQGTLLGKERVRVPWRRLSSRSQGGRSETKEPHSVRSCGR